MEHTTTTTGTSNNIYTTYTSFNGYSTGGTVDIDLSTVTYEIWGETYTIEADAPKKKKKIRYFIRGNELCMEEL